MEKIKCLAIKNGDNITTGPTYAWCASQQPASRKPKLDVLGYMTTSGRFIREKDAYNVAAKAGQISEGLRSSRVLMPGDLT